MTEQEKMSITKYDLYYESRMTKVESAIEHLNINMEKIEKEMKEGFKEVRGDLKWLLGIIGGVGMIIVGLMAHGFKWY